MEEINDIIHRCRWSESIKEFFDFANLPLIDIIDIKKEKFENFEEKDKYSNILHLKETNTDVEILNIANYENFQPISLYYTILICMSINFPQLRKLTGVYFSELDNYHTSTNAKIGLAFKHYDGLNLLNYVLDGERKKISDKLICELLIKLVKIVVSLHNVNIPIYFCLGPKNIIVTKRKNLVLTNYHHLYMTYIIGNTWSDELNYFPPEALYTENSDGTCKYDIWFLGAIMVHLFSGIIPWKNVEIESFVELLKNTPTDIYKNFDKNHKAFPLIHNCCRKGAEDRCSSKQLLEDLLKLCELL